MDSEESRPDQHLGPMAAMVEAILFSAPGPVPVGRLAKALRTTVPLASQAVAELGAHLAMHGHAFAVTEIAEGLQLLTLPEFEAAIAEVVESRPAPLSRAALETLAIIALRQPITRAAIEEMRGVQSEGALTTLIERGLVAELGRAEAPGRPFLYGTTARFLEHFGLRSLGQLQGILPESLVTSLGGEAEPRPRRLFSDRPSANLPPDTD